MEKNLKRKREDESGATLPRKTTFWRKYNPDFIQYGFISGGDEAEPRAQCVACGLTLANEALEPSMLKRHLETQHPTLVGKPAEFFKRKENMPQMQDMSAVSLPGDSARALKASYLVARCVAQSKEPFSIAQELVLPAVVEMCREVIGEAAAEKLLTIPLSNDIVCHRIADMASDIQHQLLERIKSSPFFSLQLDESTDVPNAALLLQVFVRYRWDGSLHEDLLFCRELPTRATAQDCFRCMDHFFTEHGLDWHNCVGVSSDGAASLTGSRDGVVRQILDRAPEATWTHCFLHPESLAAANMSPELHEVMDVIVNTVNVIKRRAVNSRCFAKLCEDMEADHIQLLCHSEVRWLSRGLVLTRLFELRSEVFSVLTEMQSPLAHHYADTTFTAQLAYLCDIFSLLNRLNVSLQQRNGNIFVVANKVEAFKRKLALWTKRSQEKRMDMFPLLSDILENSPQVKIGDSVSQHLSQLAETFDGYFPEDPRDGHMWILDPFSVDPTGNDVALPSHLESQLLDVSTDRTLKLQWGTLDLGSFWIAVSKEYPCLALRAVKLLLPFTTTHLCESGFSSVVTTKTEARGGLGATLRVSLSPIPPRLDLIVSERQAQVSH